MKLLLIQPKTTKIFLNTSLFVITLLLPQCNTKTSVNHYISGKKRDSGVVKSGLQEGKWIGWFKNGKIEYVGNYLDGKRTNEWCWYYETGTPRTKIEYKNGLPNGHFISFHFNGNVWKEGDYSMGIPINSWDIRDTSGKIKEVQPFVNGKTNGEVKKFFLDGQIRKIITYVNDTMDGVYKEFYQDGKLKMVAMIKDGKLMARRDFNENGGVDSAYVGPSVNVIKLDSI